jgi:ribonucleoside-diphosphate reductase alpha chain
MPIAKITKRSGEVVDFDEGKIAIAIEKANEAQGSPIPSEVIDEITARVLVKLEQMFGEGGVPGVEEVQDVVERQIAETGFWTVAKAYILYRYQQHEKREEEKEQTVERAKMHQISVVKRDGSREPFDVTYVTEHLVRCAEGWEKEIAIDAVITDVLSNLYDGITVSEINQALVMALKGRIEEDPSYSKVAARVLLNDLYKAVLGVNEFAPGFEEMCREGLKKSIERGVLSGRLDPRMLNFDFDRLGKYVDMGRDELFEYMGVQVLYDRYFLRDNEEFLEIPQYFWMRVAMGLALNEREAEGRIEQFYDVMSRLEYVPSTPTLFHAGTTHPQMSSCYLTTVEDDLDHIFKAYGDNAQLSKWSGGLGNDWTNVRGTGARIKSTNVGSQGVVPFLKIADATTAAINRSGKRRGATCAYLETWHYDIEDFLELRKNTGDDRRRTHDMNTANWIPDLFMKRVLADGEWTLFSPDETPDLHHVYGKEFERRYEEYEERARAGKIRLFKRLRAQELWRKMVTMLYETGHPWMTFKDPCNIRSPQDHVGVVHSSNLCTEITLNTSREETAVCNLGSINLARHVKEGQVDRQRLSEVTRIAVRMLDNVIDLNFYPTVEAKNSNLKHRPVGLGLMGLQDALYVLDLHFDSEEAVRFSDETMEFISYYAILGSSELAKERGAYESYRGSKWDRNLFPLDTLSLLEEERGLSTGVPKTAALEWKVVREAVAKYGMRNSNVMAIAPTATNANINGVFPSIEPIYKNIYVKSNFSGEFTTNNGYLIKELKKRGLWDAEMREDLKAADGSIQAIDRIPADIKDKYREVFEIDPIWIVRHAAARGKWIDQSQSLNVFLKTTSGRAISEAYLAAWKMGLKTTYYLRSLGASSIEKSTVDIAKQRPSAEEKAVKKVVVAQAAPQAVVITSVAEMMKLEKTPVFADTPLPARPVHVHTAPEAVCEACE